MTLLQKIQNITWWTLDIKLKDILTTQQSQIESKISSDSPAFTGTPTAPTAPPGTNTTQIATTAFVLANSTTGETVDTSFLEIIYSPIMSVAFDSARPNFEIYLTGNLDLTVTGTADGDSGFVNLYFSATEVATINGTKSLSLTGTGVMIPIYFIHDSDGIKWYDGREATQVDTSDFALQDGTILYNTVITTSIGTFSNVGNVCTGTGTTITANMIGAKITKANGEVGIIATRTSDTSFTTVTPFETDSINTAFDVRVKSIQIDTDGLIGFFAAGTGERKAFLTPDGAFITNGLAAYSNGNTNIGGSVLSGNGDFESGGRTKATHINFKTIYTTATLPIIPSNERVAAWVSDATAPTYRGVLVGGGTVQCMVTWDGTNWLT